MRFVESPNVPQAPVKAVLIDGRTDSKIISSLVNLGIEVIKTARHLNLYDAVSYHPDVVIHHLGEEFIVYAPGTSHTMLDELRKLGFSLIEGQTPLNEKYPFNIAYNVARVGDLAFHNTKYTDPLLKKELEKRNIEIIHVKQGYSKCSVSIVNNNSIITSDTGIAKAAESRGVEVLLIDPSKNILLPGLDYGFIGGSAGLIDKDKWAVTGDISSLNSSNEIVNFLSCRKIKIVSLSEGSVIDIGSIIPLTIDL